MSQPLVLSFYEGNNQVASVFLRWSAYTIPTYVAVKQAVYILTDRQVRQKNIDFTNPLNLLINKHINKGELADIKDVRLKLIRAYEKLGGGLDPDDRKLAETLFPGETFSENIHSSYGLVSISEQSMKESDKYACGTAKIYIDHKKVEVESAWMDVEGYDEEQDKDGIAHAYSPREDIFRYPFDKAYKICRNLIRVYKKNPDRYFTDGERTYMQIA